MFLVTSTDPMPPEDFERCRGQLERAVALSESRERCRRSTTANLPDISVQPVTSERIVFGPDPNGPRVVVVQAGKRWVNAEVCFPFC